MRLRLRHRHPGPIRRVQRRAGVAALLMYVSAAMVIPVLRTLPRPAGMWVALVPVLLTVTAVAVLIESGRARRRIMWQAFEAQYKLCPECMYPLRDPSGACPECGREYTLAEVYEMWHLRGRQVR